MSFKPSRRTVLTAGLTLVAGGAGFGVYSGWFEPRYRLNIKEYWLNPPNWPTGQTLTIALISDIHASEPYMPLARVRDIVAATNALEPDLILLGGDYCGGAVNKPFLGPDLIAPLLADLHAPLGCYGVFGNHDHSVGIVPMRRAFKQARISMLENEAIRIDRESGAFWLAGTASSLAYWLRSGGDPGPQERPIITIHGRRFRGADDLPATLAQVRDGAPVILLAHEPDQFKAVPPRISLTLSGHTHGGQIYIPGIGRPFVPSLYGERYAYGHIVEENRHLVVSGGLGLSFLPIRSLCPPEITHIRLGRT